MIPSDHDSFHASCGFVSLVLQRFSLNQEDLRKVCSAAHGAYLCIMYARWQVLWAKCCCHNVVIVVVGSMMKARDNSSNHVLNGLTHQICGSWGLSDWHSLSQISHRKTFPVWDTLISTYFSLFQLISRCSIWNTLSIGMAKDGGGQDFPVLRSQPKGSRDNEMMPRVHMLHLPAWENIEDKWTEIR